MRLISFWPLIPHSVISGVGELNLDKNNQKMAKKLVSAPTPADRPYPDCPYLLLDVRDRDQYDSYHIISGGWQEHGTGFSNFLWQKNNFFLIISLFFYSAQFPHHHAVSDDEPLYQRSAGICILYHKLRKTFICHYVMLRNHKGLHRPS